MGLNVYDLIVKFICMQLEAAEMRIAELETCECRKPCVQFDERTNNTLMKVDGSVWQHKCNTCTCLVSVYSVNHS